MKKHLSVLMLFTRMTLYKVLAIILLAAASQTASFARAMLSAEGHFGLDTVFASAYLAIICAPFFLFLCAYLSMTGSEMGSKTSCTLLRLRLSQRQIFLWQAACNAAMLLIFWAAQIAIVLVFCAFYTAKYPGPQAAMLAFYQDNFLHNLLPLADWSRLALNVTLLLSLAASMACVPVRLRRGQKPLAAAIVAAFIIQNAKHSIMSISFNLFMSAIVIFIASFAVFGIWKEDGEHETLS